MMYENELYHHGIKGMRWGVRRYQNEDGSYKPGAEGRYDGDGTMTRAKRTYERKSGEQMARVINRDYARRSARELRKRRH